MDKIALAYFFLYIEYIITQYINKIKTRRSPGTNMLEVPGIKEIKII